MLVAKGKLGERAPSRRGLGKVRPRGEGLRGWVRGKPEGPVSAPVLAIMPQFPSR